MKFRQLLRKALGTWTPATPVPSLPVTPLALPRLDVDSSLPALAQLAAVFSPRGPGGKCRVCLLRFDPLFAGDDSHRLECGCTYHLECLLEMFQVDHPRCVCGFSLVGSLVSASVLCELFSAPDPVLTLFIHLPERLEALVASVPDDECPELERLYRPQVAMSEYTPAPHEPTQVVVSVKAPAVYDTLVQATHHLTMAFARLLALAALRTLPLKPTQFTAKLQEFANYLSEHDDAELVALSALAPTGLGLGVADNLSELALTPHTSHCERPALLVEQEVCHFAHWRLLATAPELLVCFDYVDISTTHGALFDPIVGYLFANCIVFVQNALVIGQVLMEDIVAVAAHTTQLTLSLRRDELPEIIVELHPVAIVKWEILIGQARARHHIDPVPVKQLTTNAWDQHPGVFDAWALPELEAFAEGVVLSAPMAPETLVDAVPAREPVALNLVLCFSVVNNSGMANDEYRGWLVKVLEHALAKLRPDDTLALVVVSSAGGSFVGSAPATWDGWATFSNELEVETSDTVLALDEFAMVLAKLHSLYPFIPDKNTRANKVMVVLLNRCAGHGVSDAMRRRVAALEKLSMTVVRVGSHCEALTALSRVLAQPIDYSDQLRVLFAQHLLRFDDYDAFDYELGQLLEQFQLVVVPVLRLELEPSALTEFKHFEVNGELRPVLAQKITVVVKDIVPGSERNIMFDLELILELTAPRFTYRVQTASTDEARVFYSRGVDGRLREFVKRSGELSVLYWLHQALQVDLARRHQLVKLAVSLLYLVIASHWGYTPALEPSDTDSFETATLLLWALHTRAKGAHDPLDNYFAGLLRELKIISAGYEENCRHADAKGCDVAFSLM